MELSQKKFARKEAALPNLKIFWGKFIRYKKLKKSNLVNLMTPLHSSNAVTSELSTTGISTR